MQAPHCQPDADGVMNKNRQAGRALVGEDVRMMRPCRAEDLHHPSEGGFVVTSGRFTAKAEAFGEGRNVRLQDGPGYNGCSSRREARSEHREPLLHRSFRPQGRVAKQRSTEPDLPVMLAADETPACGQGRKSSARLLGMCDLPAVPWHASCGSKGLELVADGQGSDQPAQWATACIHRLIAYQLPHCAWMRLWDW